MYVVTETGRLGQDGAYAGINFRRAIFLLMVKMVLKLLFCQNLQKQVRKRPTCTPLFAVSHSLLAFCC